MPYTKSDIGMVMPISDTSSKNAWIFMKPLTWSLWLTILCFFIFIGFVVWVLEHRVNADFRGPLSHQVGTSFWFSFSTMVFSNRERVVSNLARFLMIVWVFVMLILTQSYTASLSSLLTVQQLSPAGTDLNVLLRNGDNVGYIENAFAREVLYEIGFNDSRLKVIKSAKDGDKELSRGTARGGIAALVAETPTLEVFVAKYCSKYTMVGPIAKTNGFAFVFPKRSPLVADMSSAILNVTEGKNILEIEAKWIKKQSNCQNAGSGNVSGNSLGLESFWGLFLVAGVTSVVALIIFFTSFLYKHKHVWMSLDSSTSIWERIRAVCELFDDRDASFNTLRSSQSSDRANDVGDHGLNASPTINWPESPFSYTNHGDLHSAFGGQQKAATRGASSPVRSNS
ncbi:glutamate receptor 2.8-like [Argentina anserina]|uniref:glutamate receptor 2.8-like n=1 Tax=Argentina anserina TaxID=57926 RepID=UPI002176744A|nr:glutamate receptor 2.8-like [Potentilla anserina]